MRLVRTLVVVVAGLALVAAVPSAQAAKGKKAAKEHHVHGVVGEVKKDADKDSGSITLTIKHKDKTTKEVKTESKTFQVTEATKFIKVSGKKGEQKEEPATFGQLKEGDHATLTVQGDEVVEVKFHGKHGKKNK